MNKLVFEVNNGRKLELVQREDNGTTLFVLSMHRTTRHI